MSAAVRSAATGNTTDRTAAHDAQPDDPASVGSTGVGAAPDGTGETSVTADHDSSAGTTRALGLLIGSIAALVAARPLSDNSFLTHLATGRLILDSGVPATNPFLYTGTSFPVPSWWWSILLAVAEQVGGAVGVRSVTASVAALLGICLVRLASPLRAERANLLSVVAPVVLALVCVLPFMNGRPHLAGFVLLALTLLVWREDRSPWWLVAVFAVWVNVHGSWLYGVVVLVMVIVATSIDQRCFRAASLRRNSARIGAAISGVILGGALYPDRFAIVLLPTRQFGDPAEREALQAYSEWHRLAPDHPLLWMMLGLAILAVWGCVRRRAWASALMVLGLVAMGVSGLRLVPIAAITLVPFAATALAEVGSIPLPGRRAGRALSAVAALIGLVTVGFCWSHPRYELDRYPVAAVDWLAERGLVADGTTHVVSHDFVGNYLEWRFGDDANAYVDDRPDAQTLIDYRRLMRLEPDWADALDRAEPDVVLWQSNGKLTAELASDPSWSRAADLDGFTVFCSSEVADTCI